MEYAEKEVEGMKGTELIAKVKELKAEDLEVICINFDGLLQHVTNVDVAEDASTGEKKVVIT